MNLLLATFCVFLFSLTAPFTRMAAMQISPESIILIRILGAGVICLISLLLDPWLPPRKAWPGILYTTIGTVIGFNSLMAYGLREVPAGHAAVALAGLPMVTSIYSVLRDRANPGVKFWIFALTGTGLSFGFFFFLNIKELVLGDFLLLFSIFSAAFGYVEGGRVSRLYGGRRVVSWAVLLTFPIIIPVAILHFRTTPDSIQTLPFSVIFSLAYVAIASQSLGMFLWFKVLAKGPMEQVALVQLLQPFFTLFSVILLLDETVVPFTWVIATLVALCILGSNHEKRTMNRQV